MKTYFSEGDDRTPNEKILEVLLNSQDLEAQGFELYEKLTVTFRLQEGDHPFQYLSCQRDPLGNN